MTAPESQRRPRAEPDAAAPETPRADRPVIITGADTPRTITEAIAALAFDDEIYQRDRRIVRIERVVVSDPEAAREGNRYGVLAVGAPIIRDIPRSVLALYHLGNAAQWMRYYGRGDEKKLVNCRVPGDIAQAVADFGRYPYRVIRGVTESPMLRPDGTVLQTAGHDLATCYVYEPNAAYPRIPDHPSQGEANAALQLLCEPFAEFPFGKDAERYVPVAMIFTVLARAAIRGAVPGFIIDASNKGSGKSKIAHVVSIVCTGRDARLLSWPKQEDEATKTINSIAMQGAPIVAWDNIDSVFGGATLDMCLTATDSITFRVLGETRNATVMWNAVVIAGGNNIQLGSDTTRRVLVARIEPNVERPQDRIFKIADLTGHVMKRRAELVTAALTVLRGFCAARDAGLDLGPDVEAVPVWGSFEAWRDLVPKAIVWAGGPDVLACRADGDGAPDSDSDALTALLDVLRRRPEGYTSSQLAAHLWPDGRSTGGEHPDARLRDALEDLIHCRPGHSPSAKQLGYALRRWKGRVIGRRRLVHRAGHAGQKTWHVEAVQ